MKILRVISSMDPKIGGPCQGIRNSIPALKELDVENEVVCLDDPKSNYSGKDTFIIHAIGPSKGSWSYSKALVPWLKINASKFDFIIVHGLWQFSSYAVYKALKTIKGETTPYFVMPHGMLDPYFQKAPDRRLKALRNWLFWKFIEVKVVNNAAGVLFTCEEELFLARQTFRPYKPKKELNVGYGIQSPPDFVPQMTTDFYTKSPDVKGKPYLLFLSRIHPKKGIDLLIKAYKKCLEETNCDFELVIAGPGCETDYGKSIIKAVTKTPNLKFKVHFTGMLSGNAKWGAFYNAEAFVLPSHQENFGIAIVEALACGKPVLISNKVNIWREIEKGNAGLVENNDLEGVSNLLFRWQTLLPYVKKNMEKNAKNTFLEHYAIQSLAKRFFDTLIKSV